MNTCLLIAECIRLEYSRTFWFLFVGQYGLLSGRVGWTLFLYLLVFGCLFVLQSVDCCHFDGKLEPSLILLYIWPLLKYNNLINLYLLDY